MQMRVPRRILAGLVLTAIILSGSGILLYRVGMQFRESRESVQHTHQVLNALQAISTGLDDGETAVRVYVLTGDPSNLKSFDHFLSSHKASFAQLRALTADNPRQQARLAELQPVVEAGLRTLQSLVKLRRDQGIEAVLMQVNPEENQREMEKIRSFIAAMRDEETHLLEQRRQTYDASVRRTSEMFAAGIVTQCLLLLLVCIVFLRDAAHRTQSAQEIANSNIRLAAILATTGDGIYQLDQEGRAIYLNPAGERLLGYELNEIRGRSMHDLIHSRTPQGEFKPAETCPLLGAMRKGESHTSPEDWYQRKDGTFITVECTSTPLFTDGVVTGAVFSFHDITERRRREEVLHSTTALQRAIFQSANVGIISTDAHGMITTFNTAAERMLQYSAEEMIGKMTPAVIQDGQEVKLRAAELTQELGFIVQPGFDSFVAKTARTGIPDEREWTYIRKDGSRFPVYLSVTALRDADGNINGFLAVAEDITERKKVEAALRESEVKLRKALEREKNVARVDFLTGILNRRGFYEIAVLESQRSRRYKRPLSLVYVDLDNFKMVNDSLGHDSGDEVLVHVAATIQRAVRGSDVVARLGGDEFSVLLPESNQEHGMVVVQKLRKHLLEAMREKNWPITFSVGVTSFLTVPESVDEMIREADRAMYSVKLKGKDSVAAHAIG
jgi:diguanylate cyclase (GGDEF)-like protein/PAS domain S-box-containing protein